MGLQSILSEQSLKDQLKYDSYDSPEGLDQLLKFLDRLGVDYEQTEELGKGAKGVAFISLKDTDRVIKYVSVKNYPADINWKLIEAIERDKPENFVRIYGHLKLPKIWSTQSAGVVIVMEKVDQFGGQIAYKNLKRPLLNHYGLLTDISFSLQGDGDALHKLEDTLKYKPSTLSGGDINFIESMYNASQWLKEVGIKYHDLHEGNVGYSEKDKVYKILDVD